MSLDTSRRKSRPVTVTEPNMHNIKAMYRFSQRDRIQAISVASIIQTVNVTQAEKYGCAITFTDKKPAFPDQRHVRSRPDKPSNTGQSRPYNAGAFGNCTAATVVNLSLSWKGAKQSRCNSMTTAAAWRRQQPTTMRLENPNTQKPAGQTRVHLQCRNDVTKSSS